MQKNYMRMKMKKSIIAILIVMLLCSTSVFAATLDDGYYYGEPKVDDYLGLNVGASFVYERYRTNHVESGVNTA